MAAPREHCSASSRRKTLQLVVILALLKTTPAQQCTSENMVSVTLNFSTNSTGHPQLNARLEQPRDSPAWQVNLQMGTSRCGNGASPIQVLSLRLIGASPRPQPTAPPGYRTLAGLGHYRAAGGAAALDWASAGRQCAQEGAALAVLKSRREAELLAQDLAFFNASGAQHGHLAWLAATDAAQEGAWLTAPAGLPLEETGYVKWHPGEPNGGNKENCMALTKNDGFFIDANCAWKLSYICKVAF